MLLFQPQWELTLPEIHDLRQVAVAGLRYQYVRNLGSDRFDGLVARLQETGPEARDLWDRYVIGFPRRRYTFRMRDPRGGIAEASYLTGQFTPRIAMMLILLPPDLASPWPDPCPGARCGQPQRHRMASSIPAETPVTEARKRDTIPLIISRTRNAGNGSPRFPAHPRVRSTAPKSAFEHTLQSLRGRVVVRIPR